MSYEKQSIVDLEWGDGDGENEERVSENRNEEDTDKAEELMKRFVIRELKKRKIILVRVKRE